MKYDERLLDEIKSRLRLSDVIGRSVKLRRQGREYAGLSPFTKEKTPSFFVNDDKGFYHCFSSGKHGDLISFLMETQRLSFPEAVEQLANEAGVALPVDTPQAVEQEKKRQGLGEWLEQAAKWFEAELNRPAGAEARVYLERRGLPKSEWGRFRIGFAPSGRTALKDYLVAKGARPAELVEAGLLIAPEDGGAPYDRFRDRIIFPISDLRGRVISFGGRAMDPEARAKYLNGPDSPLFDKGRTLYGLSEARKLLHAGEADAPLAVVEGYMDVIACHRAGIAAAAPMGTALTEGQMEALWRLHPEPTLCFDGDGAGQRAAARAIDRALPLLKPGRSFKFTVLEGGKDPDDVLRDQGPAALKGQLSKTEPLVDVLYKRELGRAEPIDTPERRTALKAELRRLAAVIADKDLSAEYRRALLDRYDVEGRAYDDPSTHARSLSNSRWQQKRLARIAGPVPETVALAKRIQKAPRPLAAAFAQALLEDPARLDEKFELIEAQGFFDDRLKALSDAIVRLRVELDGLDAGLLINRLRAQGYEALLDVVAREAKKAHAPFLSPSMAREEARMLWSRAMEVLKDIQSLDRELAVAGQADAADFDRPVFYELKARRDSLARAIGSGEIWQAEPEPTWN